MGYKPPKQHYRIMFDDRPGLEVIAKSVTLGKMHYVSTLKIDHRETDESKRMELFDILLNAIVRWNIEHPEPDTYAEDGETCAACELKEGTPLPLGRKYLVCLDIELVSAILSGWIMAVARASLPKEMSSNSGGMSGPSIPLSDGMTQEITERLERLQNQVTLPTPNLS